MPWSSLCRPACCTFQTGPPSALLGWRSIHLGRAAFGCSKVREERRQGAPKHHREPRPNLLRRAEAGRGPLDGLRFKVGPEPMGLWLFGYSPLCCPLLCLSWKETGCNVYSKNPAVALSLLPGPSASVLRAMGRGVPCLPGEETKSSSPRDAPEAQRQVPGRKHPSHVCLAPVPS